MVEGDFVIKGETTCYPGIDDTSKTATPHAVSGSYSWDIDKDASVSTIDMFKGDTQDVKFTVTAVRSSSPGTTYYVDGTITITNTGGVATQGLSILDTVQSGPSWSNLNSASISTAGDPVLDPQESYSYPYSIPFAPGSATEFRNHVDVSVTNSDGHYGNPYVVDSANSNEFNLPTPATATNSSVTVNDTNGQSWEFSDSGSQTYTQTYSCDADEGTNTNTATIEETQQSATANVDVNCYSLEVVKTVNTSFDRVYDWTILKTALASSITLLVGQTADVGFNVNVSATSTDQNYGVNGTITIHNPAPISSPITDVNDIMSRDIAASVDCPEDLPYNLPAGENLVCAYSGSLPDNSARTNTATVTIENQNPEVGLPSTNALTSIVPTTVFSDTEDVTFDEATINEINECINVNDSIEGVLGTVCNIDTLPKVFSYNLTVGPYVLPGTYTSPNTASFIAVDDPEVNGSSTASVNVIVNLAGQILGYSDTRLSGGQILGASSNLAPSGANLIQLAALLFMLSLLSIGTYLIVRKKI